MRQLREAGHLWRLNGAGGYEGSMDSARGEEDAQILRFAQDDKGLAPDARGLAPNARASLRMPER